MTTVATPRGWEAPMASPDHDARHCGGPECFQDDGAAVEVCACDCAACVAARERLLLDQGEGDEPDSPA